MFYQILTNFFSLCLNNIFTQINEALELALEAIDREAALPNKNEQEAKDIIMKNSSASGNLKIAVKTTMAITQATVTNNRDTLQNNIQLFETSSLEPIYENVLGTKIKSTASTSASNSKVCASKDFNPMIKSLNHQRVASVKDYSSCEKVSTELSISNEEPYYQVPKPSEPYYEVPKNLKPVPVYENIEMFYSGIDYNNTSGQIIPYQMEPPKEKPPPPPAESPPLFDVNSSHNQDSSSSCSENNWCNNAENTYEKVVRNYEGRDLIDQPSPPIQRMNSTKRIKKEIRNKRSSFLGIEGNLDDDDNYLELTVAPPPDMAQLLQEERRLEKQLYMKVGLCDSSDTGKCLLWCWLEIHL